MMQLENAYEPDWYERLKQLAERMREEAVDAEHDEAPTVVIRPETPARA